MDVYPTVHVSLPLVFQDSSTEDTFGSVAAALRSLVATTEEVFGRIEARAAVERLRLAAINARLARCREKTALVAQSTRAVTIFAVPKFPAADVARHATFLTLHDGISHPAPGAELVGGDESGLAPMGARPLERALLLPDDEVVTRPDKRAAVTELLARVSLRGARSDPWFFWHLTALAHRVPALAPLRFAR